MGTFRPYESWDRDFDQDFIEKARFTCKACGEECSLEEGHLMADGNKVFALGNCSVCRKPQRFDVTDVWREE